jgi:hypothetical protein
VRMNANLQDLFLYEDFLYFNHVLIVLSLFHNFALCHEERLLPIEKKIATYRCRTER